MAPTIQYEDYAGLVYSRAASWATTTNLPVEEVLALNNLIFCEACKEWNGQGKFSTFLWHKLNLCRRLSFGPAPVEGNRSSEWERMVGGRGGVELDEDRVPHPDNCPHRAFAFKEALAKLSPTAQHTVRIVLSEDPSSLLGVTGADKARKIRGAIVRHLREEKIPTATIYSAFREIKQTLQALA